VSAAVVTVLAAEPLAKSGEALKAGPIGLGVILLLCIACYFLFKSMSKHLRTVREQFPEEPAPPRRPGTVPPLLTKAEFARSQATKAEIVPPAASRPALDASTTDDDPETPTADE
jgi:hypothetical protein